jgi:hypothetical protein
MVPNDYKIWFTEYGVSKDNAVETWATGMRYAALVVSWLNRGDKIGQLGYHYVSKDDVIKVGSPMQLAPIGIAAELLAIASADMTEMQKITFNNNPISNGVKSLYGYKFKNSKKETLFIININDTDFSQIETSNLFTYNGQYHRTQYYSNAPYVSGVYKGHSNIISNTSTVSSSSFNAKKFSITTIEVTNVALSTEYNSINKVSIYPNPTNNILYLKGMSSEIKNIELIDVLGHKQTISFNKNSQSINLQSLKKGVYFLKVNNQTLKVLKL